MNLDLIGEHPELGMFFEHMTRLPLEKVTPMVPPGGAGIGMHVIPVYGFAYFIDYLVLNTVEFWTGSNPLASGDSYYEQDAQGNSIAAVKNEDGSLSVELTSAKGEKANLILQRDENVVRALDANGELVAQYDIEK